MKLTRTQLRKLIQEAMYDPRPGLEKRQQAYDALPSEERELIEPFLSSSDEENIGQGEEIVDALTG